MNTLSRRSFLKVSMMTASGFALSHSCKISKNINYVNNSISLYDAKALPTTNLGRTGVLIPRMAIGLGSRFCNIGSQENAIELLEKALNEGLYYWDTASDYTSRDGKVISEEIVGKTMKGKREKVFLSTKVLPRDPNEALRSIELSLKRLQTDQVDVLNIHAVHSLEDNREILKKGGVLDILYRMKEEKVTRFIGLSGHADPIAMNDLIEKGDFDCTIVAMNHYPKGLNDTTLRTDQVIPTAKEKNMGTLLMKVIRPLDTVKGLKIDPEQLIRYALSHDEIDAITIGMDSMDVLESNLKILKNFKPMNVQEKDKMTLALTPFFDNQELPWMSNGYRDGNWV